MKQRPSYVLVTPARDEQATIEETLRSVLGQTWLPDEWLIVSDGSVDRTDDIVKSYQQKHSFIRLLRREADVSRGFGSVVFATEFGIRELRTPGYDFLGLLDADVRFAEDYFEALIGRFLKYPRLGLAGGIALDVVGGRVVPSNQNLNDVAGAVHFFRSDCFAALGGLQAIPEGGWDAITNLQARAHGYGTQTFPDLVVEHLKPRNSAEGGAVSRHWQLGVRDYALGYLAIFEIAKSLHRWREPPALISSVARLSGFLWSVFSGRRRFLSPDIIKQIRGEQKKRLAENLLWCKGGVNQSLKTPSTRL